MEESSVIGKLFKTDYRTDFTIKFKVLETENYKEINNSSRNKSNLSKKPKALVAIKLGNKLIPNLSSDYGITKLKKICIDEVIYDCPEDINRELHISIPNLDYRIQEVT